VQGARSLFFLITSPPENSRQTSSHRLSRSCERLPREPLRAARRRNGGDARLYTAGEYDVAGFVVGIVDREK
jgi:hypothetical protein